MLLGDTPSQASVANTSDLQGKELLEDSLRRFIDVKTPLTSRMQECVRQIDGHDRTMHAGPRTVSSPVEKNEMQRLGAGTSIALEPILRTADNVAWSHR